MSIGESTTGHDKKPLLKLKQIGLTTAGHKLLGELRAKSRVGKLKERLGTLAWAVIASAVTTLAMLAIKGASLRPTLQSTGEYAWIRTH